MFHIHSIWNQKILDHPSAKSYSEFQKFIRNLWFDFYSRKRGVADTSGFEHVFVGELLRGESDIGGMHNWLRFHQLEESGAVNYAGYVVRRGVCKNKLLITFTICKCALKIYAELFLLHILYLQQLYIMINFHVNKYFKCLLCFNVVRLEY